MANFSRPMRIGLGIVVVSLASEMDNRMEKARADRDRIKELLAQDRLKEALELMGTLLDGVTDWSVRSAFDEVRTSYGYMLQFYRQGAADQSRSMLYGQLVRRSLLLADDAYRAAILPYSMLLVDQARRARVNRSDTYDEYRTALEHFTEALDISEADAQRAQTAEKCERTLEDLFTKIWTDGLWTAADREAVNRLLDSPLIEVGYKCMVISAVTLSLLERFDLQKMQLLGAWSAGVDASVSIRALTGLALACMKYDAQLKFFPEVAAMLSLMADDEQVVNNIRSINSALLMCGETEKIDRKMRDEIIPTMLRNPKLGSIVSEDDPEELNPEWEKWLEDSGVKDGLMEMTELQMEGADIYMSTFSHLKNYPFFKRIHNWFRPFDVNLPEVEQQFAGSKLTDLPIGKALLGAGVFCDSDKYSFCFTFGQIPAAQRDMVIEQLTAEVREGMESAVIPGVPEIGQLARQYVQDLYRFFKIYPRRHEFSDPFAGTLELPWYESLWPLVHNGKTENLTAEFLLRKGHYKHAVKAFERIGLMNGPECTDYRFYQKKGYACQMSDGWTEALECYRRADILQPDNLWTMRHTAQCMRQLGNFEGASALLDHALELTPDDLTLVLMAADCLVQRTLYAAALKGYYKVLYMKESSVPAWRGIAWCSFMTGDLQTAQTYYGRILASKKPSEHDFLNAGHVELCLGNIQTAVSHYTAAVTATDRSRFLELFSADRSILLEHGISPEDIPLLLDLI